MSRIPLNLLTGIAFSFLHILVFSALFVLISNFVFTPSHRFTTIFNAALSNQFFIVLIWYTIFPAIYLSKRKPNQQTTSYKKEIGLKIGSKIVRIATTTIQLITTDKPYSVVYTKDRKILENKSLKDFETELDPTVFLRVHRSTILNTTFIKELKSRNNGDYDAILENEQVVRLSRHFRNNWKQLIQ